MNPTINDHTINNVSIIRLYYRYKSADDDLIKSVLNRVQIVHAKTYPELGYYPITTEARDKIYQAPRKVSLTFDACETQNELIGGLKVYRDLYYLVKSTSRFFLKPDFGEIVDAMEFDERHDSNIVAVCFDNEAHQTLPNTEGEHFLMKCQLLIKKQIT